MPPRFSVVSNHPKCKVCNTTVYPQERVDYDQGTWHQTCFKCLECKSTLTMAAVAMIDGQAYCKTCFKRIFLREGRYSSFENRNSVSTTGSSPSPTPASDSPAATTGTSSDSIPSASAASTIIETEAKESSDSNDKASALPASQPKTFDTPALALKDAIATKNRENIRELIDVHGVDIIFEPNEKGLSALESTLGHYEQKHMGAVMLDVLKSKIAAANTLFAENNIPSPFAAK